MAYDREHGLLVWGGTLPGDEIWSNSMRMAETEQIIGSNDAAGWDVQELLDHYSTVIKAHHANDSAQINTRAKLTWVKFNRVDINGHYIDPTTYEDLFAPISGAASGSSYPNQVTLVVTFTTAVSRGPANKGRIFTPMPASGVDATTGLISTAAANLIAGAYKTFIEALSDVPGVDSDQSPGACVMSKVGSGVRTHRITGVRVGRVLDTQRRRRNALEEDYSLATVDQGTF